MAKRKINFYIMVEKNEGHSAAEIIRHAFLKLSEAALNKDSQLHLKLASGAFI